MRFSVATALAGGGGVEGGEVGGPAEEREIRLQLGDDGCRQVTQGESLPEAHDYMSHPVKWSSCWGGRRLDTSSTPGTITRPAPVVHHELSSSHPTNHLHKTTSMGGASV